VRTRAREPPRYSEAAPALVQGPRRPHCPQSHARGPEAPLTASHAHRPTRQVQACLRELVSERGGSETAARSTRAPASAACHVDFTRPRRGRCSRAREPVPRSPLAAHSSAPLAAWNSAADLGDAECAAPVTSAAALAPVPPHTDQEWRCRPRGSRKTPPFTRRRHAPSMPPRVNKPAAKRRDSPAVRTTTRKVRCACALSLKLRHAARTLTRSPQRVNLARLHVDSLRNYAQYYQLVRNCRGWVVGGDG